MGNQVGKSTPEQKEWLLRNHEYQCLKASQAIKEADMFLLCIGAGFSADSGLAVYKDIANIEAYHAMGVDYHDLCTPKWMSEDPEIFYGFWGKCFNDYRETTPHDGYNIIRRWKDTLFTRDLEKGEEYFPNLFSQFEDSELDEEGFKGGPLNPFFIFSSNVDSHPQRMGFTEEEIYEIHGSIENWQCNNPRTCVGGESVWKAPSSFEFKVDLSSMRVKDEDTGEEFHHHPKCINCSDGALARPNILMFGDSSWFSSPFNEDRYRKWLERSKKFCAKGNKMVILEIGCGMNVPTVRMESERISTENNSVTLIRINPDFPLAPEENAIEIQSRGLVAVQLIDEFINGQRKEPEVPKMPFPVSEEKEEESPFSKYSRYVKRSYASDGEEIELS